MGSPVRGYGDNQVTFTLNDELHKVSSVPGNTSLNTYIREYAGLKGTKFMCREGGCGICVVSLQFTHPVTGQERVVSVNSCMFPVYACHGLKVTTVEGIGNKKKGYHEIQSRLAHFYGTQCGYCSPGWVMAMYSLLESNPKITMKEIEESLSGNLCRCTGYRPILDAFKSFGSDKSKELEEKVADIEDLLKVCPRSGIVCNGKCKHEKSKRTPYICEGKNKNDGCDIEFLEVAMALPSLKLNFFDGSQWYKVDHVDEIFEIFGLINGTYMLVGGNTSKGILKDQPSPGVMIDINSVAFLKDHTFESNHFYIGANTTLADAIVLFKAVAEENPHFRYLKQLANHIEKVANTHVRNVGTLAGNLSIKHQWRKFQSDIFLILETVGAVLCIRGELEAITLVSLTQYLETDMYKKIILQIILPPLDCNSNVVKTFKIAPRAQNALAYVNGGFRISVNREDHFRVLGQPTIVFGGIHPSFIHAYQTEEYLSGKHLLDMNTLQTALKILEKEIRPDYRLPDARPEYRRQLCQALLYRVVLNMSAKYVTAKYRSGGEDISRPLSSGKQEFNSDSTKAPLYMPFPKLDSILQCSGEAEYIYDMPTVGNELHAAFVITKHGPATLERLDPSKALSCPGVVAFFSARDIPGENTFTPEHPFIPYKEQLFAEKDVLYAGQLAGVIVADTQEKADNAAQLVEFTYSEKKKPLLDVREAVRNKDTSRIVLREEREVKAPGGDVKKVVKGEFKMETQYHFTMETMSCLAVPIEDGMDVYCTTQWMQVCQEAISRILNIPENCINMKIRRLGGGFGQKLTRANIIGGACSLAAYLLQKPVRIVMKLETVMEAIGKRWPCYCNYEAGVNKDGNIQYVKLNVYEDAGCSFNDIVHVFAILAYNNVYDTTKWGINMYDVKTDKACTAWTRAPGTLEAITMAEHIISHIAHEVHKDCLSVRMMNFDKSYPIGDMVKILMEKADYDARKQAVEEFNKANVWKKRGLCIVPMRFPMDTLGNYHAMVSVYRDDGTCCLVHGGVEIGQGINTKAAQVCASVLGIPLYYVVVKPTNNLTCPNNSVTGGSFTSESVCYAVQQCCIELNKRLEPVRAEMKNPAWPALIQAAYAKQVNLNASYMFSPATDIKHYDIFGVASIEVEVDMLTGEHVVRRADVYEDTGKSLNPFVDIGQVEGAFVMGLGYFTREKIIHDPETGRVLTNRTLKYEIPGTKDIPADFRIYFPQNGDNPHGILRSKAVGEPPLCLSVGVLFAIRQALQSVRRDLGMPDLWLNMDTPFTAENIILSSGIKSTDFQL